MTNPLCNRTYDISLFVLVISFFLLIYNSNRLFLHIEAITMIVYLLEIIFILWLLFYALLKTPEAFTNVYVILTFWYVLCSYLLSPYVEDYSYVIKFIGYLCCFVFGAILAKRKMNLFLSKKIFFVATFIPLLIVFLFDRSPGKSMFFSDSNMFTLWGVCCSMLFCLCYKNEKRVLLKSSFITIAYLMIGTSMGIIVSVILSVLLLNKERGSFIKAGIIGAIFLVSILVFVDIPITSRIRNTFDIFTTLSLDDWKHIDDVSLYKLEQANKVEDGGRTDNTSAIWRIQQWIAILIEFSKELPFSFIIGLGANASEFKIGVPHNEWLRIFANFGFVVFVVFLRLAYMLFKVVKERDVGYFLMSFVLYMLTENIFETFVVCCVFCFVAGYSYNYKPSKIVKYE